MRPRQPFPYYSEVMTGFEYAAAVGMIQEGLTTEGLECIRAIRDRYDGRKRNPFDEAECGHHYGRAMAAWSAVTALTGFCYSAVDGTMRFLEPDRPVTWFWSTGDAYGTFSYIPHDSVELNVLGGRVVLDTLVVGERCVQIQALQAGESWRGTLPPCCPKE